MLASPRIMEGVQDREGHGRKVVTTASRSLQQLSIHISVIVMPAGIV
jgi:hypothetical protein